jgi:hypothetical protein
MGKSINLIFMVLMAGLAVYEGYLIVQFGADARRVVLCLLFTFFAIRRAYLFSKG